MTRTIAIDRIPYNTLNSRHQFFISCALMEPTRKSFSIVSLKTFHIFAMCHHLDSLHYLSFVVADVFEGEEK